MVTNKDRDKLQQKYLNEYTPYDSEYKQLIKEEHEIVMRIVDHEHVLDFMEKLKHRVQQRKEEVKKLMEEYKK